jgi:hypothetical protein
MVAFTIIVVITHTKHNMKIFGNPFACNKNKNPSPTLPHTKMQKNNNVHKTHGNLHTTIECWVLVI